jgi:hypothetical protein
MFLFSIRAICSASLIFLHSIVVIIFCERYKLWSSLLCSFPHFPVTSIPPLSKYSPQYPVLKQPESMFLH